MSPFGLTDAANHGIQSPVTVESKIVIKQKNAHISVNIDCIDKWRVALESA